MGESSSDNRRVTRRVFVATGVATGAAVVWTSPFPFADSPIGQNTAEAAGPTGPTGTATPGPTGTATPSPTGGTGTTGAGKDKLRIKSPHRVSERSGHIVVVAIAVTGKKKLAGKVKLQALVGGKLKLIGTAAFHTPAGGGARNVRVHLNHTGKQLSKKQGTLHARITASGTGVTTKHKSVLVKTLSHK